MSSASCAESPGATSPRDVFGYFSDTSDIAKELTKTMVFDGFAISAEVVLATQIQDINMFLKLVQIWSNNDIGKVVESVLFFVCFLDCSIPCATIVLTLAGVCCSGGDGCVREVG